VRAGIGRLLNFALVAGGTLAGLLLAEAAARLFLPPPATVTITPAAGAATRRASENAAPLAVRAAAHHDLQYAGLVIDTPAGRRMRANTEARLQSILGATSEIVVRTNSLGYRSPEIGPKPKDRTRVLFLGDSITLSVYLPEEASFVRRVEALSEAPAAGERFETINAAVAGISLADELAILQETGFSTDPDVVVLGFFLNDAAPSPGVRIMMPPSWLAWSWLARDVGARLPFLLHAAGGGGDEAVEAQGRAWRDELRARYAVGPGDPAEDRRAFNAAVVEAANDWGSAWTESAWDTFEPLVIEFRRVCDAHHAQPMVVAFPVAQQIRARFDASEPQRRLAAIAARLDIPLLDLLPPLKKIVPSEARPVLQDHCHYTDYGNEVLAPWILEFLRTRPGRAPVSRPS
jgi:lysophospholipase L1-like esterase